MQVLSGLHQHALRSANAHPQNAPSDGDQEPQDEVQLGGGDAVLGFAAGAVLTLFTYGTTVVDGPATALVAGGVAVAGYVAGSNKEEEPASRVSKAVAHAGAAAVAGTVAKYAAGSGRPYLGLAAAFLGGAVGYSVARNC